MSTRSAAGARLAGAAVLVAATAALAGCAPTVSLDAAPHSNAVGCAEVTVRLPDRVADLQRRHTDAQATAAWGDPASVLLRCGVPSPGPTTLPCVSVNGIDWVQDDSNAPDYRFVTFGRHPATEVILDDRRAAGSTVLADLSDSVGTVPQEEKCLGAEDTGPGGD